MRPSTGSSDEAQDQLPALQADPGILKRRDLLIFGEHDDAAHVDPVEAGDGEGDEPMGIMPPHIAKRFARPGTNRRRASAASSRRNSMTSSASHQSRTSRSARTPCRASRTQIDNHLRRASILEDRKARLADRAAHVEQVRLRAAMIQAAPRGSNLEERALAAHQQREKLLAKVAASCAEEVSRAKRVAEENKERRAAEERRYRQELEDKYAEADRRRLELRRANNRLRARTASIAAIDVAKSAKQPPRIALGEADAASRIQRAWRAHRRRGVFAGFGGLNLSVEHIRSISFEQASALLAEETTTAAMQRLLTLFDQKLPENARESAMTVRTFLSAYMIIGHAPTVFSQMGQQEQDLITKAKDLLVSFESLLAECSTVTPGAPSPHLLQSFTQAHSTYVSAFQAWKAHDSSALVEVMVDQFAALDAVWQSVKDETAGGVAADYREGIRNQQIILLSKIKKLAGPDRANAMIKKAIRDSRRAATAARRPGAPAGIGARPRAVEAQVLPETHVETQITRDISTSPSESEAASLDRIFSVIPPNRTLVHELLIDANFRIEPSPDNNVRSQLNRHVCESMRLGIAQGETEEWTVAVAAHVRSRLLKVLVSGMPTHTAVSEALDIDHVRAQCRRGVFSYDSFFAFMANLLPQMCAPIRDAEVAALAEALKSPAQGTDAMLEKLFGLLHAIDVLSLDYTNFLIAQQAPVLIGQGPGYESRMFEADVAAGQSLARHTQWWRAAAGEVEAEVRPAPFAKVYAAGLAQLVAGNHSLKRDELPETLALDFDRLQRIRTECQRAAVVGGVLLTAKNLLRRDVRVPWRAEGRRALAALRQMPAGPEAEQDNDMAARLLGIIDASHPMPAHSRETLAGATRRFVAELAAGKLADPLLKLLLARLRGHLAARLGAVSAAERVAAAASASTNLANAGLGEAAAAADVGEIVRELGRVAEVDRACHGPWLDQVAAAVQRGS